MLLQYLHDCSQRAGVDALGRAGIGRGALLFDKYAPVEHLLGDGNLGRDEQLALFAELEQ